MDSLIQILINCVISGFLLALVAYGFGLIFNVLKVFHLAHGVVYVAGAYFYLWMKFILQQYYLTAILSTLLFVILLSVLIEKLVYKPLDDRNSGQAITLISSMGLYILFENIIALFFGNETRTAEFSFAQSANYLGFIITPIQLTQFVIASVVLIILFWLSKLKYFLQIKAVISNQQVASVLGINFSSIRLIAIVTGSILAIIVSILKFYDTGIDPHSGMGIALSAAVVVIIAGRFSLSGILTISLLLSILQASVEWFLSAQWKDGITFAILLIIILWKTEGIVSYKMRIEES
jgi:branched-chain amino acid transport system permease protein